MEPEINPEIESEPEILAVFFASLACALIAQYRLQGIVAEPTFRFLPPFFEGTKFEYTLFHILVQTPSGYEDPSKELGMLAQEYKPFYSNQATDG